MKILSSISFLTMKMELFQKNFNADYWPSGDMPTLSDLQLVYMVHRNSTQLLNINTTKFQVEREPVYCNITIIDKYYTFLNVFIKQDFIKIYSKTQ